MKITIELTDADIENGKFVELYEMFAGQPALQPSPQKGRFVPASDPVVVPVHDPEKSVGAYADPTAKDPKESTLLISLGEGMMKEIVDLWETENDLDRAEEIRTVGSRFHSANSMLAFVKHMQSLSHAIHHVRVREGKDDSDWQRSEEIALNMTQIASLVFPDLAKLYQELFSWERGDPTYTAYRRAIENV